MYLFFIILSGIRAHDTIYWYDFPLQYFEVSISMLYADTSSASNNDLYAYLFLFYFSISIKFDVPFRR